MPAPQIIWVRPRTEVGVFGVVSREAAGAEVAAGLGVKDGVASGDGVGVEDGAGLGAGAGLGEELAAELTE